MAADGDVTGTGLAPYTPQRPRARRGRPSKALVLAGGGATGIAWEAGVIAGLREEGIDVRDADVMVGTSAGSVVAAHLRLGTPDGEAFDVIRTGMPVAEAGRLGPADAVRFARAQASVDRRKGRAIIGRAALRAEVVAEEEWIETAAHGLHGRPWPAERLLVTAVDARTGTAVVFDNTSGVPLDRAVAASCAVPGVFPPVTINGNRYLDGGLRSVANADLAWGYDRVLVLSPIPLAVRRRDRPRPQARWLGPSTRSLVIAPDLGSFRAMGTKPMDTAKAAASAAAGRAQGQREADRARRIWLP